VSDASGPEIQKIGTRGQAAALDIAYLISRRPMITLRGRGHLKLEIDDRERRAIDRSLVERRSHLIEKAGDTTLASARRRADLRDRSAIASALQKLRRWNRCGA
jgi:hypothetical protein